MHPMKPRILAAAAALAGLAFATQPFAEQKDGTVAKLVEISGNVLVSRDSGLTTGTEAMRLLPKTRILTTANARAIVEYDDGCRVRMEANQRFEVERDRECAALVLLPQAVIVPVVAPLANTLIPAIIGGAAIGMILDSRGGQTVSPN
jgi:hypothetical protein